MTESAPAPIDVSSPTTPVDSMPSPDSPVNASIETPAFHTKEQTGAFKDLYLTEVPEGITKPYVDQCEYLVNGEVHSWDGKHEKIFSPILDGEGNKIPIGLYPLLTTKEALSALSAASEAFDGGHGKWPMMSIHERIRDVEKFLKGLMLKRDEIINLLMWEICKNKGDATKEFDRTVEYINDTIAEVKKLWNISSQFTSSSGILAQIRRVPLGVCVCIGPFNYPFNETYTVLFPALLMGNTVILKTPRTGCLCHMPTIRLFQECFPPGVINVVHGSGREVLPPVMESGLVDIFAFIGTSKAAIDLHKVHPSPNRLRVCLGLDAKNPGIICADADLDVAVTECVLGSLSYNGQRCTALKLLFVHESKAEEFVKRFCEQVDKLKIGLPWTGAAITPLPEPLKPRYLRDVIADAVSKGAKVVNARGAKMDVSWVSPTVMYPVTPDMRLYHEEQFGPIVPIVTFKENSEVVSFVKKSSYGQQASIFSEDPYTISEIADYLVNQVSRVNINCQCQRGPDILPFTGRKNSACGTLSVADALKTFSIRTVVATKQNPKNMDLVSDIMHNRASRFLRSDYMF